MDHKYRRRNLALIIISVSIHDADGLICTDFGLTGVYLSSKVLSIVWNCSHSCHKLTFVLVIGSDVTMSSLNART